MTEQELGERIIKLIKQWEGNSMSIFSSTVLEAIAKQIHIFYKQANYVQLDPDQSLPPNPYRTRIKEHFRMEPQYFEIYVEAQEDMVEKGWRKVKL